jgi:AcrR family transcriptional regulator
MAGERGGKASGRRAASGARAIKESKPARPARRNGFDRRDQLAAAALRLFSERQYDEVSIDDIAEEAQVAHGLLSYYFAGKRGAYLAALQMVQADLEALTRPLRSDGDVAAQIRGMTRRHFEYFRAHPQVMLGLYVSAPRDPETRAIVESNQQTGAQELLALLRVKKPPPVLQAALRGCMAFLQEVTVQWLNQSQNLEIDQLVDLCYAATTAAVTNAVGHPIEGLAGSQVAS